MNSTADLPHGVEVRGEITPAFAEILTPDALTFVAKVFMADFEDANAPKWTNMIEGQINVRDAIRRTIRFTSPEGKEYRLKEKVAVMMPRPRGWHLPEKHVLVDGEQISGGLFDFGLF